MALLNPLANAFGLDIGDRTFKLAQVDLRSRDKTHPYRITAWNTVDVPEGVMDKGDIKDVDGAVKALGELLRTVKGRLAGRAVVACLPEAKTFIKIIEVPAGAKDEEVRQAVVREIETNIPLPTDELYFDYTIIDDAAETKRRAGFGWKKKLKDEKAVETKAAEPPKDAKAKTDGKDDAVPAEAPPETKKPLRVLMGAAPKQLVDDYSLMLERAGLATIALEIEATAVSRAIVPIDEFNDEAVGILDIGATRSSLVIYDSGALQMSISIPVSGIAITQLISEALSVSMEDAEKLKRECGLDSNRCEDKMWNILLPLIDDITDKIRNALRFYKIGFPSGKKIERLYLCGGGAAFREIDTVLSRKLTIKTQRGDTLANVSDKLPKGFPDRDEALQYATAIGLAVRAADENARHRNSFV